MKGQIILEALVLIICLSRTSAIVSSGNGIVESKASLSNQPKQQHESNSKSDQVVDAQASASHHYGGFGDNGLGSGLGSFGEGDGFGGLGGYGGGEDHHRFHDHHDHHEHHHFDHHHDHHQDHFHKALAIKGLLVPLAGVALLGAAAAFVSNPILLQLGVISGTYGRRRRREAEHGDFDEASSAARLEAQSRLNQIHVLESFMSQVPKEQMFSQEKKLMASYLTCSGMAQESACLERLSCELHHPGASDMPQEANVMNIIATEIFNNDLVPVKTKQNMSEAVQLGRRGGDCSVYRCTDMESFVRSKTE